MTRKAARSLKVEVGLRRKLGILRSKVQPCVIVLNGFLLSLTMASTWERIVSNACCPCDELHPHRWSQSRMGGHENEKPSSTVTSLKLPMLFCNDKI